jgi:hypothetical protein
MPSSTPLVKPTLPWGREQFMAVAAVNYCLGRRTYAVGMCVDWLHSNWPSFNQHTKTLIQRDIEEAFAADENARKCGFNYQPLGDDCDRAEWARARTLWVTDANA